MEESCEKPLRVSQKQVTLGIHQRREVKDSTYDEERKGDVTCDWLFGST
jgi:hypothetical protein